MTDATDPADARAERRRLLFARPWSFRLGVARLDQLPAPEGVEVAFAGRSNVGKSSLINAVLGQKDLARTSNTPGRTQELNYFEPAVLNERSKKTERLTSGAPREGIEDAPFIVDMPGYGYAKAPKDAVKDWTRLVFDYLRGRANLRRVYVLIDSRHGLKDVDLEAMKVLDTAAVSYQVVLTKADKIAKAQDDPALADLLKASTEALRKRPAAHPVILVTSSDKGWGIEAIREEIAGL